MGQRFCGECYEQREKSTLRAERIRGCKSLALADMQFVQEGSDATENVGFIITALIFEYRIYFIIEFFVFRVRVGSDVFGEQEEAVFKCKARRCRGVKWSTHVLGQLCSQI